MNHRVGFSGAFWPVCDPSYGLFDPYGCDAKHNNLNFNVIFIIGPIGPDGAHMVEGLFDG